MSKIRLLTKDELFDNPLEIIKETGRKAYQTEFELRMTRGWSIARTCANYYYDDNGVLKIVNEYGDSVQNTSNMIAGIRPVLNLDIIPTSCIENAKKLNYHSTSEIKYGYFPSYFRNSKGLIIQPFESGMKSFNFTFAEEKDAELTKHLVYLGEPSTFNLVSPKYVYLNSPYSAPISGEMEDMAEVEPIEWYVDHDRRICISKYILMANIDISNITNYLENIFLPEIVQFDYCYDNKYELNSSDTDTNINDTCLSFDDMVQSVSRQMEEITGKSYTKKLNR